MPHTYTSLLLHCVFATKHRRASIPSSLRPRLWAYIGGIAHEHGWKALAIGGTADHLHILLSLPPTQVPADAIRDIKSGSSRWMHKTAAQPFFAWQEAYGAFSIGHSQLQATIAYIDAQEEHHKKRGFQAEFLAILNKHHIIPDQRDGFEVDDSTSPEGDC